MRASQTVLLHCLMADFPRPTFGGSFRAIHLVSNEALIESRVVIDSIAGVNSSTVEVLLVYKRASRTSGEVSSYAF